MCCHIARLRLSQGGRATQYFSFSDKLIRVGVNHSEVNKRWFITCTYWGVTKRYSALILAPDGVYSTHLSPNGFVCSYHAFPPLPKQSFGGLFLLPSSSGFPGFPLESILLCGARTFLTAEVPRPARQSC